MTAQLSAFLTIVLSAVLVPVLVAIAAIIGLARARKTILVFAIAGLLLYVLTEIGVRSIVSGGGLRIPYVLDNLVITFSSIAVQIASQLGIVGGILALIHSAHLKRWSWFGALLAAALVTAIGGLLQNPYVLSQVLGTEGGFGLLASPSYLLLANGLYCVSYVVQILYGIFGPAEAASATSGDPTPAASV